MNTNKITDITDVLILTAKKSAEKWIEQNGLKNAHLLAFSMLEFGNIAESFDVPNIGCSGDNPMEPWYFIAYGRPDDYAGIVPPGLFHIEPAAAAGVVMFESSLEDATILRVAEGHHLGRILVVPNKAKLRPHEDENGDSGDAMFLFEYEGAVYAVYSSSAYLAWGIGDE